MKKVVCLILLLGSFATLSAQTFTAEMKRAGMMWYFADYQNADQARKIKVVGDINGDDIRVLRQLAGGKFGKELDEPDRGCLEELDLSEARIVAGGGAYVFAGLYPSSHVSIIMPQLSMLYTEDDVVGGHMFSDCKRLKRIILPRNVDKIQHAFEHLTYNLGRENMTFIEYVQLPENITEVYIPYVRPMNLKTLACPVQEPPVATKITDSDTYDCDLLVPVGSKEKYAVATGWKDFRSISEYDFAAAVDEFEAGDMTYRVTGETTVELINFEKITAQMVVPEKVEHHDRFYTVEGIANERKNELKADITSVELPNNVLYIGDASFYLAADLQSINFPEGLREIGARAFEYCGKLEKVELPDGIKFIGCNAFADCWNLKSLRLPADLEVVGSCAFNGTAIEIIELPATLRQIGGYAFFCNNLKTVVCHVEEPILLLGDRGRRTESEVHEFSDFNTKYIDLYVPDESVDLYKEAPVWKEMKIHPMSEYVPTAVEELPASGVEPADRSSAVFTTGGVQVLEPQRGVNIVKETNEPARKVLVP
jgi:hypothetical protein